MKKGVSDTPTLPRIFRKCVIVERSAVGAGFLPSELCSHPAEDYKEQVIIFNISFFLHMKLLLSLIGLLFISYSYGQDFSGYTRLPKEKLKHFVPFSIDSINNKKSYASDNFTIQEVQAIDIQSLSQASKYTWVVLWAPWCAGMKEVAQDYIKYERELGDKDIRLVFVAVGYGPDGIKKVLNELNYEKPTYVVGYLPGRDNNKVFRKSLNNKYKYRNANHYIFKKDKGLIYTASVDQLPFQKLKTLIKNYPPADQPRAEIGHTKK